MSFGLCLVSTPSPVYGLLFSFVDESECLIFEVPFSRGLFVERRARSVFFFHPSRKFGFLFFGIFKHQTALDCSGPFPPFFVFVLIPKAAVFFLDDPKIV